MQPDIRDALNILLEALADNAMPSTQYYATGENVPRGKALYCAAQNGLPDFFIIHPDDFAAVRAGLPAYIGLIPLREWRPR